MVAVRFRETKIPGPVTIARRTLGCVRFRYPQKPARCASMFEAGRKSSGLSEFPDWPLANRDSPPSKRIRLDNQAVPMSLQPRLCDPCPTKLDRKPDQSAKSEQ
jgi:hypothetical protein